MPRPYRLSPCAADNDYSQRKSQYNNAQCYDNIIIVRAHPSFTAPLIRSKRNILSANNDIGAHVFYERPCVCYVSF